MCSDPKPNETIISLDGDGTIVAADAGRPLGSDFLELQGRMAGIGLEELEVFVSQVLDGSREPAIRVSEIGVGKMPHSSRVRPAL